MPVLLAYPRVSSSYPGNAHPSLLHALWPSCSAIHHGKAATRPSTPLHAPLCSSHARPRFFCCLVQPTFTCPRLEGSHSRVGGCAGADTASTEAIGVQGQS